MIAIRCKVSYSSKLKEEPNTMKRCIALRLSLLLVFLLLAFMPARAQEMVKSAAKQPADSPETNVSERVRLLESELERQNTKLDQLQKSLVEQQATIQAL